MENNQESRSNNTDSASDLGEIAYEKLTRLLQNPELENLNQIFGYGSIDKRRLFPELALQVCQSSKIEGRKRIETIISTYFASPFKEAIIDSLNALDNEVLPRFFVGIKSYMLTSHFDYTTWKPYLIDGRQKTLILHTNVAPESAKNNKEIIYIELGEENLLVDIHPSDNGSTGLIHAIAFQPDFILSEGRHLVGLGGLTMLYYLSKHPKTKDIPYSIIAVNDPNEYKGFEVEIYNKAKHFLLKPHTAEALVAVVQSHLSQIQT